MLVSESFQKSPDESLTRWWEHRRDCGTDGHGSLAWHQRSFSLRGVSTFGHWGRIREGDEAERNYLLESHRMKRQSYLWGLFFTLALAVQAETVRLAGDSVIYSARGQDIVIEGDNGSIVISGSAGKVTVRGQHNDVVISEAAELITEGNHLDITIERTGAVYLGGNHNDVVVQHGRPVVTRTGVNNDIVSSDGIFEGASSNTATGTSTTREEVVTRSHKLTLDGSAVTQTLNADGQDVILNGASNNLTLTGRVKSLTVNGGGNKVTIESTSLIRVNGAGNSVRYRSGSPEIDDVGYGNSVTGP